MEHFVFALWMMLFPPSYALEHYIFTKRKLLLNPNYKEETISSIPAIIYFIVAYLLY